MIKRNIRKYKIIEKHMLLVRRGKYDQAKVLLHLLRKGRVTVGISDTDCEIEFFLEEVGCYVWYGRSYLSATFTL